MSLAQDMMAMPLPRPKSSAAALANYESKLCMLLCQSLVAFQMTQASIVDNDDGELMRVNLINVQVGLHSFKRCQSHFEHYHFCTSDKR